MDECLLFKFKEARLLHPQVKEAQGVEAHHFLFVLSRYRLQGLQILNGVHPGTCQFVGVIARYQQPVRSNPLDQIRDGLSLNLDVEREPQLVQILSGHLIDGDLGILRLLHCHLVESVEQVGEKSSPSL